MLGAMPFKSISSPRRAAALESEVRGGFALASPATVTMISTDPVRLGMQPQTGTAKIVNASLDAADEVALLGKDVAIVKSGDDVWALLGVTHQPKMEQVARDVRSIAGAPGGESVLCLGWDGTATALTLGKNEVSARPFALRGAVRCIDLVANECWTVVDGGEAGELRIHPGATPEPGAKDRVTLPRAAKKADRVRGGRELGVVFERGAREATVVMRTASRMQAKVLAFAEPALDLAVAETSLFASFADGRVALYDGAAIAAAGEGPIEPTHVTPIGASGEPRVVVAAGKGQISLWIGTSTGEVLSAAVARKTPS